jgi:hypothetical protein
VHLEVRVRARETRTRLWHARAPLKQMGRRVCFVRARLAFVRAAFEETRACLTHGHTRVGRSRVRVSLMGASLRFVATASSPTGTRLMFRGAGLSLREAVRSQLPLRLRVWERPLGLEDTRMAGGLGLQSSTFCPTNWSPLSAKRTLKVVSEP